MKPHSMFFTKLINLQYCLLIIAAPHIIMLMDVPSMEMA